MFTLLNCPTVCLVIRIMCFVWIVYSIGVANYPRKGKKKPAREERTAVCIVHKGQGDDAQYLIVRRPSTGKENMFNGMEHVPNIFMSFDKYLFLEVINILIYMGLFKQSEIQLFKKYLKTIQEQKYSAILDLTPNRK